MRWRWAAVLALAALPRPGRAVTVHLITGSALVNHVPAFDFRIGTQDDGVMGGPIPPAASGPNAHGAASFAVLAQGTGSPTGTDFDRVFFLDGAIELTPDVAASTADTIVLRVDGGSLRSTPDTGYPGAGEITTALAGTTLQLPVSFQSGSLELTGSSAAVFPLNGAVLTSPPGFTTVAFRSSFGFSGDLYIDHVLTPLAPPDATAILCIEFTGTATTPQGFATHGILAAYTTGDPACADAFPELCGAGACTTFETCAADLASALPAPATAASPKARRTAASLRHLAVRASGFYRRGTNSSGLRRAHLYARARAALERLRTAAITANGKGTLGVSLDPVVGAVGLLLGQIPRS